MDFAVAAKWLFDVGWSFLTCFNIPGTNFTPLAALFFSGFVVLVVGFIRSVIGHLSPSQPPVDNRIYPFSSGRAIGQDNLPKVK